MTQTSKWRVLRLVRIASACIVAALGGLMLQGCVISSGEMNPDNVDFSELSDEALLLKVQAVEQGSTYDCGVSALSSVLQYYKFPAPEELTSRMREVAAEKGFLTMTDMKDALKAVGMSAFVVKGDLGNEARGIPNHLRRGRPCVVLVRQSDQDKIGHFVTVAGFDPKLQLVVIADSNRGIAAIPVPEFEKLWAAGDNGLLIAAPASGTAQPKPASAPSSSE